MSFVIIPNHVRDDINAALDRELALFPEAESCRQHFYSQLLNHFNEHGEIPDFTIKHQDEP